VLVVAEPSIEQRSSPTHLFAASCHFAFRASLFVSPEEQQPSAAQSSTKNLNPRSTVDKGPEIRQLNLVIIILILLNIFVARSHAMQLSNALRVGMTID
jgi:hypothetical protein